MKWILLTISRLANRVKQECEFLLRKRKEIKFRQEQVIPVIVKLFRLFGIMQCFTFKKMNNKVVIKTAQMSSAMRNYLIKKGIPVSNLNSGDEIILFH